MRVGESLEKGISIYWFCFSSRPAGTHVHESPVVADIYGLTIFLAFPAVMKPISLFPHAFHSLSRAIFRISTAEISSAELTPRLL